MANYVTLTSGNTTNTEPLAFKLMDFSNTVSGFSLPDPNLTTGGYMSGTTINYGKVRTRNFWEKAATQFDLED